MDQSITLKIAGKEYAMKATSPEMEQMMRTAAEVINQKLTAYDARFPDKTLVDKLAFVALNESVARISYQKRLSVVAEETKEMLRETDKYLDSIEKK